MSIDSLYRVEHHLMHLDGIVSCSNDMSLKLWDTNNEYKNTKTLHGHDHTVSAVRFMPGGDFIISSGRDQSIRVWEVATG